ncbi:MAG: uracil-DNA glycosylase [Burkholderiales bacterium]
MNDAGKFSIDCRACPRLADFLDEVKCDYPKYFARPVPPFGADNPRLLIVGLAPGMHGANQTGRPFTGDFAGILLYETLHKFGYASQPTTVRDDSVFPNHVRADPRLRLINCRITNAVKCLPPGNKPETGEIKQCNGFLRSELAAMKNDTWILALGGVAHKAVLMALDIKIRNFPFAHGAQYDLPRGMKLIDSYHCSRYNTNTRRLTPEMFEDVFRVIKKSI